MIAVIADDFTGAAEIGGLGIRFQMKVEIVTRVSMECDADLLIVVTDTRSKSSGEAILDISQITAELMKLQPELIYKKIDSVLRGHIVEELLTQMQILGKSRALVVPANPHLGRIIKDGIYYLKSEKLHETSFKNDPEFVAHYSKAMNSSNVIDILKPDGRFNVVIAKIGATVPTEGIVIGEAQTTEDLLSWAGTVDHDTLMAGASSFFLAVLEHAGYPHRERSKERQVVYFDSRMLVVCGSSFSKSRKMVESVMADGASVSIMPSALLTADEDLVSGLEDEWVADIVSLFAVHHYVIVAADPRAGYLAKDIVERIRKHTARAVAEVMRKLPIQELVLEGGSTASSILSEMGLEKLYPEQEISDGVIRTSIPGSLALHITFKPGSYRWPGEIWNFKL